MPQDKGMPYWVYWGMASLTAALIGGFVFPWLMKTDPLKLKAAARSIGNAAS
jgi:hypothetical protein